MLYIIMLIKIIYELSSQIVRFFKLSVTLIIVTYLIIFFGLVFSTLKAVTYLIIFLD